MWGCITVFEIEWVPVLVQDLTFLSWINGRLTKLLLLQSCGTSEWPIHFLNLNSRASPNQSFRGDSPRTCPFSLHFSTLFNALGPRRSTRDSIYRWHCRSSFWPLTTLPQHLPPSFQKVAVTVPNKKITLRKNNLGLWKRSWILFSARWGWGEEEKG